MISDHLAHILGALIIIAALVFTATWTALMVLKWAGDALEDHVAAALGEDVIDARILPLSESEAACRIRAQILGNEAERWLRGEAS